MAISRLPSNVRIVDSKGLPTPEFQRAWNAMLDRMGGGAENGPSTPTGLAYTFETGGVRVSCDLNAESEQITSYQWRLGATWETASVLSPFFSNSFFVQLTPAHIGTVTVWVAAVDVRGKFSTPASIEATITAGNIAVVGARGNLTGSGALYGISVGSWSDAKANRIIYNMLVNESGTTDLATTTHLRIGDTITLTDGTSFVATKYWNGASWISAGSVIEGNLLVNGEGTFTGNITGAANLDITGTAAFGGATLGGDSKYYAVTANADGSAAVGGIYARTGLSTAPAFYGRSDLTSIPAIFGSASGANTAGAVQGATDIGVGVLGNATGAGTGVYARSVSGTALYVDGTMQITSGALVTNLNAYKLEGNRASAFLGVSATAADSSALGGYSIGNWLRVIGSGSGSPGTVNGWVEVTNGSVTGKIPLVI